MIDADLLLAELRRNQRSLAALILLRDIREVGTCLVMLPLWFYLGIKLSLPWTWYLTVPVLVWIAGYLLADRLRHGGSPPEPAEPLREVAERSLAQVDHQIWLLRNVFWWYLLPPTLSILAFFGQVAWLARSGGWMTALGLGVLMAVLGVVYGGIYRINQHAIRTDLEPRRGELEALLKSLEDEIPPMADAPS